MYSNTPQNDYIGKEQQQYGNNSRQQQQYLVQQQYMQQQNNMQQSTNTNGGYSYESNNPNHNGDGYNSLNQKQSRFTRPMQIQQQQIQQLKLDSGSRQRGNYPPPQQGGRNEKNRPYNNSLNNMNNNQNNEHLYGDLGSNGEMPSRGLSSDQRPSEGE
jgi:hypothetical protein